MRTYYIIRKGSNSANQTMCDAAILGTVDGKKQAEAVAEEIGSNETDITVYANQWIKVCNRKEAEKEVGFSIDEIDGFYNRHPDIENFFI